MTTTDTATPTRYPARVLALHQAGELRAELHRLGATDEAAARFLANWGVAVVQVDTVSGGTAAEATRTIERRRGKAASVVYGPKWETSLLLTGTAEALDDAAADLVGAMDPAVIAVGEAVRLVLRRDATPPATVTVGPHTFDWSRRVYVMGILNATPDSFSDFGRYFRFDDALTRAREIAAQGADLIEVGGQTAQPGAVISVDEELSRIVPLLERLRDEIGLPLAVDTFRAAVARGAVAAGVAYINDIGGGGDENDAMARLAAETGVLLGIMHIRGKPKEKQWDPAYESVMDEITGFLHERIGRAVGVGVAREKIVIDPGLGFGKEATHDLAVMRRFAELRSFGLPILLATSRKNYLSDTLGLTVRDLLPETAAAVGYGITQGGNVIRVHDVAFMARIARVLPHILGASPEAPTPS